MRIRAPSRTRGVSSRPTSRAASKSSTCRWRSTVAEIPYGQTRAYGEVARRIRRPNAVRAVGAANGQNPLPIVIPCHRVIGSNGSLTGYGGGLPIKRALLALESRQRPLLP